jgi:carboxypeptidase family protein
MLLRFRAGPIVPLLLALPAPAFGLQVEHLGAIMGTVRQADRGPVLVGARVALLGTTFAAITTARGEFAFNGLTPGKYVIQASAIGFGTLSSEIEVKARETLEIAFEAQPEGVRLPELKVVEKPELPSEFVRRSETGGGRYYSREAIERRNAPTLGDLLRTVPGLRVNCATYPCRIQLMRQRRSCPMAYWLDGAPVDAGSVMLQSPRELDGVEVYSGLAETPSELYQHGTCGALVVWTRTPPRAVKKPKAPKPAVKPDTVGVRYH